jgi:hypothetical protein
MTKRAETGVGDPRKRNYHPHHPMRVEGVMPHDMDGDGFIEYQILHGMTEGGYWLSVHYTKEHARWRIHPGKSSKVTPATLRYAVHDLVYRDHCDCEEPKYVLWGHRWDLRPLHQCHNCGEVITKPPRIYHNNLIDNTQEQEHDDTDAEVLDQAQSDAA